MHCNIKPVPFHKSDKHIFAKIPGGGGSGPPVTPLDPPMAWGKSDFKNIVEPGENAGYLHFSIFQNVFPFVYKTRGCVF